MNTISAVDEGLVARVLDLAVAIQQIPAPTFAEERRAAFVRQKFLSEALCDVTIDKVGNVYARWVGKSLAPPVVVSAHLDTVFPLGTALDVVRQPEKISGPGIGDNSMGLASLFGLIWALQRRPNALPGDLWLVATVGEEGLGNLRGMEAVIRRFRDQPQAYVVLEGMAFGQIYVRGFGVKRYRITAKTAGGHAWGDFGDPSAIHEMAILINKLLDIPLPVEPRTSLNVGVISGGTTVNSIAAEATIELDLRSEAGPALQALTAAVEQIVAATNRNGVQVSAQVTGHRPSGEIAADHPLVQAAVESLEAQGITPGLCGGSTDANLPLSLGLPAVCIGMTLGENAHTPREYILTHPVSWGLKQLVGLVENVFA